jgi:hypothetical protein
MTPFRLSRRAVLRGFKGAVAVALCPLEAMFDGNGLAFANGAPIPKRYVMTFMGNGIDVAGWNPTATGAGYPLSPQLSTLGDPAHPVKSRVRVLTNVRNTMSTSTISHWDNAGGVLTGLPPAPGYVLPGGGPPKAPSADFIASKTLQGSKFPRGLQLGVCTHSNSGPSLWNVITFDDGGGSLPGDFSPASVFNRCFGSFSPPDAGVDPKVAHQLSVLDGVKDDLDRLEARLGATDRVRLEQHLTALRELELSIKATPSPSTSCVAPSAPAATSAGAFPTIARQMTDLLALALACDLTRVASIMFSRCGNNQPMSWLDPTMTAGMHDYTHPDVLVQTNAQFAASMNKIVGWHVGRYADLVWKLAQTPEGQGSVLDNTVVLLTSENGQTNLHSKTDVPMLVAGLPAAVRGDFHARPSSPVSTCDVYLSCLQAVGCPVTSFGSSAGPVALS